MRVKLPLVMSGLVAGLILGVPASSAGAAATSTWFIVGLAEGADPAAVIDSVKDLTLSATPLSGLSALHVEVGSAEAAVDLRDTLSADTARVRYIEQDSVVYASGETRIVTSNLVDSKLTAARTWTTGDPDVTVAVIDTGVTPGAGIAADRLVAGRDFADGDDDASDDDGHGTAVAKIIGAASDSRIMPVRVLRNSQSDYYNATGSTSDAASGIVWAADHGAKVIAAPFSTYQHHRYGWSVSHDSQVLRAAVEYAAGKGALVVSSSGEYSENAYDGGLVKKSPGQYEPAIAVGGSAQKYGDWVDVTTPANDGTGVAEVAGTAALVAALKPAAGPAEIRKDVLAGTRPAAAAGLRPVLDAAKAVSRLGAADKINPALTSTGLVENELINAAGKSVSAQATDDHAIERIDWLVGGKVVASALQSGVATKFVPPAGITGVTPVTVRAYDYAGNTSETTVSVRLDTKAPTLSIVSPTADAVLPWGNDVDLIVSSPDTDIASLRAKWADEVTRRLLPVAGTNRWQGKVKSANTGSITVVAVDAAGNETTLRQVAKPDVEGPTGGKVAPADGTRVRGTFATTLSGVVDPSGITQAQILVNGKVISTDTVAPFTGNVPTGLHSGTFGFTWRVFDKWNNVRSYSRSVVADNAAPIIGVLKSPANKATVKGTVTVSLTATDPGGVQRTELIINGKVVATDTTAAYALSVNTANVAKTMNVQFRAYDRLGNVRTSPVRVWYRK